MMLVNKSIRAGQLAIFGAALLLAASCNGKDAAPAAAADPDAQAMQRGLGLLHERKDPVGAEAVFREVLQRTPTHYGARYQLAVALDRGGRPGEARAVWQQVLGAAQNVADSATIRTAQARLAAPDTASQEAMMILGLDLMYRQANPNAAAEQFRRILQRNPTHYGATYQLATALDKAGQRAQATPLWQKVLGMAITYKDDKTAQTARERLK